MHIGLMPLADTDIEKGKCGFKAIQYLSLGIPAVVSPVGANLEVVDNGVNGFVADSENEWMSAIEKLINDAELRKKMGEAGRKKL
jgi:glycosyltransferase involved in cell wall biosynthesis